MTIKEMAARIGVSDKAIYKRLKSEGISLSSLKTKGTSSLSPEGERLLLELYSLQAPTAEPGKTSNQEEAAEVENGENPVENSTEQVENGLERLKTEVERWRKLAESAANQVEKLEALNKALTDERDFLRLSLERSQQLQAMTAAKLPSPAPALQAGGTQPGGGILGWFRNRKKKKQEGGGKDGE